MKCAISGEVPKEPVISPKSGAIFDRVHIVNYISTSGKDPISDEPLTIDELVSVKSTTPSVSPSRITNETSIPSLLSAFQNEWDSLALELFTLRKQLQKAKQELSAALYHQDAAVRVAARAIKERDEARDALQELTGSFASSNVEEIQSSLNVSNIPADDINQARDELFKLHKSQKPTYIVQEGNNILISFIKNHVQPFKKLSTLHVEADKKLVLSGSPSGSLSIYEFDGDSNKPLNKISGKGVVSAASYVKYNDAESPIASFSDIIIVGHNKLQFKHNHSDIIKLITHPKLKNLFVVLSKDSWSLNNVDTAPLFISDKFSSIITSGDIHFDGALLGIGNNSGTVNIFNLPTSELVFTLQSKYLYVKKIRFAFNGYWLLITSSNNEGNSSLEILDLRKNIVVHTIESEDEILDFIIDPSSSLIVTYDKSNSLKLHRFVKKGKSWLENVTEKLLDDSKNKVVSIELITSVEDRDFVENKIVKFIAVTENSSVLEYQISCQ